MTCITIKCTPILFFLWHFCRVYDARKKNQNCFSQKKIEEIKVWTSESIRTGQTRDKPRLARQRRWVNDSRPQLAFDLHFSTGTKGRASFKRISRFQRVSIIICTHVYIRESKYFNGGSVAFGENFNYFAPGARREAVYCRRVYRNTWYRAAQA